LEGTKLVVVVDPQTGLGRISQKGRRYSDSDKPFHHRKILYQGIEITALFVKMVRGYTN